VQILRLSETPEHTDVVARWLWQEWGEHSGVSLEETRVRLLDPFECPPTLLALVGSEPAGVIGFRRFQRRGEPERSLFIDAIFVAEPFRGRGIGSALLNQALASARPHAAELFVYTERRDWYEARGWQPADDETSGASAVLVYPFALVALHVTNGSPGSSVPPSR
jgi:GNAT superfamily N-acetyltransferase